MSSCAIITLGCKVNQCESAALGHLFEAEGYTIGNPKACADIIIINTCTVTGKAAMQSRQAIRKAIRNCPAARIVVTGCYAQTAPAEIEAIEGVDLIVGHHDKLDIARLVRAPDQQRSIEPIIRRGIGRSCDFSSMPAVTIGDRTRAFLKIQDGCNTFCTYCIVPYARGRSRSMPVSDVIGHMQRLTQAQVKEVVLTGIHLGAYGEDFTPPTSLVAVIENIVEEIGMVRIRLSSIEPTEIDDRLIEVVAGNRGKVCRHFHIPLQSGDDEILRRMKRPYTSDFFTRLIGTIRRRIPGAAIGVDVMAGFPGESDAAFEATYRLLERLPISYLHVFPYSPRKGTPAASYAAKVPERIAKARCRELRTLGEKKRSAFFKSMIGRAVEVLTQTSSDATKGYATGLSDNYIPVAIGAGDVKANELVTVRISEITPGGKVTGEPVIEGKFSRDAPGR